MFVLLLRRWSGGRRSLGSGGWRSGWRLLWGRRRRGCSWRIGNPGGVFAFRRPDGRFFDQFERGLRLLLQHEFMAATGAFAGFSQQAPIFQLERSVTFGAGNGEAGHRGSRRLGKDFEQNGCRVISSAVGVVDESCLLYRHPSSIANLSRAPIFPRGRAKNWNPTRESGEVIRNSSLPNVPCREISRGNRHPAPLNCYP